MSKKVLILLSICLVAVVGIALYVWADGCCSGDAKLCNGWDVKDGETECDYEFNVQLDRDCVTGSTVRVYYEKAGGGPTYNRMLTMISLPPLDWCVDYRVGGITLDSDNWDYWFTVEGTCRERLPPGDLKFALETNCD